MGGFFKSSFHFKNTASCGFSSFGRAPPCQGGGSEFEPRNPLQVLFEAVVFLKCGFSSSGRAPPSQGGCGEFESRNPLQSQKSLQRGFWLFPFVRTLDSKGPFTVIEYQRDLSVTPGSAQTAYFCNEMNVRKRQVICDLSKAQITLQAGAMQWTVGNVNATTGVKGVGDFFGKALRGQVSGESAIKPEYTGDGILVLEPTYKHILLIDLDEWGNSIVLDDGLFLACDSRLKHKAVMRANISSAVAGGEGLFNLGINGSGILCLESLSPKEELIEVTLKDDVLKVDGNMAIAWSGTLDFTVERSGKSLIGSAASGEGLVNVYRGTGKVLMAPVNKGIA